MYRATVQRSPGAVALRPVIGGLLGSLLLCGSAGAEPLTVSADQVPTSLAGYVELLEDPESRFRFEEVSSPPLAERFRANTSGRDLNFGNTRSAYWFRFRLANPGDEPVDLLLEVGFLDRPPAPEDEAVVGVVDLQDVNRLLPLSRTRAWNFQQGAMLHWLTQRLPSGARARSSRTADERSPMMLLSRNSRFLPSCLTSATTEATGRVRWRCPKNVESEQYLHA